MVRVRHGDVLYMREKPSARSTIVARKRPNGCGIRVNGRCRGNWCPVEDGHSLGWAHRRYLAMVSPSLYCVAGVSPGDALNLRAFPSPQSRVIVRLSHRQCDIAFLPYTIGSWQKVRVRLGYEGWVKRRFLSGE